MSTRHSEILIWISKSCNKITRTQLQINVLFWINVKLIARYQASYNKYQNASKSVLR